MAQNTNGSTSTSAEQSKQYQFPIRDKICESLYLDSDSSDVTFLFPKKDDESEAREMTIIESIPAHKIFLKKGSEVFCEMFNGLWKEKGEVVIVDATPEAFKEFLQCFYLGSGTFTKQNIDQVMYLADKYMIDDCLIACSSFLIDAMTLEDICSAYTLAILYKQSDFRKFCEDKIKLNAKTVFDSADFLDCNRDTLAEVLKLDLFCEEKTVFDGCLNWAKNACKKSGFAEDNIENLRAQLGDCLYLIRFGNMKLEELCQFISKYKGLLRGDELEDAMQCIGSKGYESEKFIQKPRLCWDDSKIWQCRPGNAETGRSLQTTESVQITSNKTTLLGGVYGRYLFKINYGSISTNASIDIIEKTSTPEVVLSSGTMNFNSNQGAYVKFSAPIIIKEGIKYEIRLGFNSLSGKQPYYYASNSEEVKSPKGLKINFNRGFHIISGLDLMDVCGD